MSRTSVRLALAVTVVLALVLSASAVLAGEFRAEGWPLPDLSKSRRLIDLDATRDLIDACPGEEIYQEVWAIRIGDLSPEFKQAYGITRAEDQYLSFDVNKLKKGRQVVSYYLDLDGTPPMDVEIVDVEGKGVFQLKAGEAQVPVPDWVLKSCK